MIPDRARMEVMPVSVPHYYQEHVDAWIKRAEHPGAPGKSELDLSAVRPFAANTMYYDTRERFDATPLAAAAPIDGTGFHQCLQC